MPLGWCWFCRSRPRGPHRPRRAARRCWLLADYSRLLAAEAKLQDARIRLEQMVRYLQAGSSAPESLQSLLREVAQGAAQARSTMDGVIREVIPVVEDAYLGFFDGKIAPRLAAVEDFRAKVRGLTARYNKLNARVLGEIDLDKTRRAPEELHLEIRAGHHWRHTLDRLIVQLDRPAGQVKLGLIEYLD